MNAFEELLDEAFVHGIDIKEVEPTVPKLRAMYMKVKGKKKIFLPKASTQAERTCLLAEEYGHHETGGDRVLRYNNILDWKAESRARRYAHDRLLTPDAIRIAAQNTDDIYEIAFALNVTVEFLRDAIDCFRARGLWVDEPYDEK